MELKYKIIDKFKKLQGIKKPYNATFYKCECDCGVIFNVRSERLKTTKACKKCTITLNTKERKGGLFSTIPNYSVFKRKYNTYKRRAKTKGIDFSLTIEEALDLFKSDCYYCGLEPQEVNAIYNGNTVDGVCKSNTIDRVDSNKGYLNENVVPACNICNKAKLQMSEEEFIKWVKRVYNFQDKKSSTTIPHEGSTL